MPQRKHPWVTWRIVDSRLGDADCGDVGEYLVAIMVTISAMTNLTVLLVIIFIYYTFFGVCAILVFNVMLGGVVHKVGPIVSGGQRIKNCEKNAKLAESNRLGVGRRTAGRSGELHFGCRGISRLVRLITNLLICFPDP